MGVGNGGETNDGEGYNDEREQCAKDQTARF